MRLLKTSLGPLFFKAKGRTDLLIEAYARIGILGWADGIFVYHAVSKNGGEKKWKNQENEKKK